MTTLPEVLAAEKERLTVRPGESWSQYRHRQHAATHGKCDCPHAYSLCKYSMYWRAQHGDFSIHGGWGWGGAAAYGWGPLA